MPRRAMVYTREPLAIKDLWRQYLKKRMWTFLILLLCNTYFPATLLIPGYYSAHDRNTASDARARIVQSFELKNVPIARQREIRKQLSNALLTAYAGGLKTDIDTGGDTAEHKRQILNQLAQAQRGYPVVLDTKSKPFVKPVDAIRGFVLAFLILLSIGFSARYTFRTLVKAEYLADLPWRRGWPVLFALLLPLLIPAFIASAIRLEYAKRNIPSDDPDEAPEFTFTTNEKAARDLYFNLRFGGWQTFATERLNAIKERLSELTALTRARQQERSLLLAEQRKLEQFDLQTDTPDSEKVAKEFAAIISHPHVHGINQQDGLLLIYVTARFRFEGALYDLGDWVIAVSTKGLSTLEVRPGTKVAWHIYAHPIYRLREGVFCFGARTSTINDHLKRGEISKAILVAVDCLNDINPDDRVLVPKAFKVIDESA